MSRRVAFPFLTLGDSVVTATPWMIAVGEGEPAAAGDFLPDWDYASTIRLQRTISVNRETASEELGIADSDLSLAIGLRIGTGRGRLPRAIVLREFTHFGEGDSNLTVEIAVPGSRLSTVLDLFLELVLDQPPGSPSDLSPDLAFDRVWHDSQRIRLEGEEPRFPLEVADFGELLAGSMASSAPWYLHWSPRDWSHDFHGALRLYLNSSHPRFLERVEGEDPETLRALLGDVMGQVCERFVSDDDLESLVESCEPGSLGSQAMTWLGLAWPGRDVAFARSLMASRPGVFRAAFFGLAELRAGDS